MKVLYVYDEMPKSYQTYMANTLTGLKKVIDVTAFAFKPNPKADAYPQNSIIQKLKRKIISRGEYEALARQWATNYNIIHLQHSYLFGKFPFFLDPKQIKDNKRTNIVITFRGGDTYVKPWIYERWKTFFESWSHQVTRFVTVSHHQKEYLASHWGIPLEKIEVIPVSVADHGYAKVKRPNKGIIKIASAHRMTWEKNIDAHLRTISILKQMGHNVQYDVYGDGPDLGALYYLVDKYQLSDTVNHQKKVPNQILLEKLPTYDFFLQLSLSESLGAAVLEAQSCGVPAIVSNAGGLPETIVKNESGLCVDPWDVEAAAKGIHNLFTHPETYEAFSQKAIAHISDRYTIKKEIERLIALYQKIL